jgi:predicted DNA-binding protein with PD1-like motif
MKFKKIDGNYILRLESGEEIIATLLEFCAKQGIMLGSIVGLGGASKVCLASYRPPKNEYDEKWFDGVFEIAHLYGNISEMNGKPYIHVHACIGDKEYRAYAGHLKAALVSPTCEITIRQIEGSVARFQDPGTGLNFYRL